MQQQEGCSSSSTWMSHQAFLATLMRRSFTPIVAYHNRFSMNTVLISLNSKASLVLSLALLVPLL